MKRFFAWWLCALLVAALLPGPAALMEEALPVAGEAGAILENAESTESDEAPEAPGEEVASGAVDAAVLAAEAVELDPGEASDAVEPAGEAELIGDAEIAAEAQPAADGATLFEPETTVEGVAIAFNDAAFRQYVYDSFDANRDGVLTQAEVDAVLRIDVTNKGIADLTGIGAFKNLKQLICDQNKLSFLDLSGNPALEIASCSGNWLSLLNVSQNANLAILLCQDNQLTALDVSNCPLIVPYISGAYYALSDGIAQYNTPDGISVLWCDPGVAVTGGEPVSGAIKLTGNAKKKVPVGTVWQIDLEGKAGKKFKSSRKSVATVDQNGLIRAVGGGKARITCKVGKKERALTLTVTDPTMPNSVVLNLTGTTSWYMQDPLVLVATIPNGTHSAIKWKSSNKKVATVKDGVMKFKKAGKVTITATCVRGGKQDDVTIRVVDGSAASAIAIVPPTSTTLKVGNTVVLTAIATMAKPSDPNNPTYDPKARWSSSDASVASINSTSGALTAKKAGAATITVTAGSRKTSKIRITVVK